ncbi:hypothetical protein GL50803_005258 [Giardia duodenalis]|uniref:Uncharacterized protein n=2 Tax=Giardia intestinalis TaxID=5741 RepID=A8BR00_GIAIC|nr:hypothetical protein GL50803_005258 [Giardia intestinalis]ESU35429.1 Hypothetical protein DHA2_5258 [Giardia intestinalis]KAE8304312.1 hypothetical protein GL50803_005258 [Giardia intestinalis]|eukprot:XP_001705393.1 Hypothetical protein GL50803_5258 [Giardia lamblia ATCC 50803]
MTDRPSQEDLDELQREMDKKEAEAKKAGVPFNRAAALRRIAQSKGRFYDSAEFILKQGRGETQPSAYFNKDITKETAGKPNPPAAGGSRFAAKTSQDEDDNDDNDE